MCEVPRDREAERETERDREKQREVNFQHIDQDYTLSEFPANMTVSIKMKSTATVFPSLWNDLLT